jgi:hypothetical protein
MLTFVKEFPVAAQRLVQETGWLKIIMGVYLQAIVYGLDLRDFIRQYIKIYKFVRPEINVASWNTRQRKAVTNCPWAKIR